MVTDDRISNIVEDIIRSCRLRAPSLIVTVLGDSIAPHGGNFWIGSMIRLMEPFGLNERLVRTSIFRLTRENWLSSTPVGRRSFYSLTTRGLRRFEEAFHRVYDMQDAPWDGEWTLAMLDSGAIPPEDRDGIRREMTWSGFGTASNFVFAHATLSPAEVRDKLADMEVLDHALILRSRIEWPTSDDPTVAFVRRCWDLDQIAEQYADFLATFRPLWQVLSDNDDLAPELCFMIRTLLIHEYRRLTLRDPQLPVELIAPDWEGTAARTLTRNIYCRVTPGTERHLMSMVETMNGPLPAVSARFNRRFGGLDLAPAL